MFSALMMIKWRWLNKNSKADKRVKYQSLIHKRKTIFNQNDKTVKRDDSNKRKYVRHSVLSVQVWPPNTQVLIIFQNASPRHSPQPILCTRTQRIPRSPGIEKKIPDEAGERLSYHKKRRGSDTPLNAKVFQCVSALSDHIIVPARRRSLHRENHGQTLSLQLPYLRVFGSRVSAVVRYVGYVCLCRPKCMATSPSRNQAK